VLGLLAELPRKHCWTIAEQAGDPSPDRMQHLLSRAKWDAGGVRDDVRGYVIEHLGDPAAVPVIDETGDVKKGTASAGVQRQDTGTAGRIENAQVAVYLGSAAPRGHTLIDRDLYLPKSRTADEDRCAAAGIPAGITFATKPQLARKMIERAVTARVPFGWVAGDEVYGGQRAAADLAGTGGDRVRARGRLRSPGPRRGRAHHPRRSPGRPPAPEGLAAGVRGDQRQRTPLV
jgi:SRSO17 transposase